MISRYLQSTKKSSGNPYGIFGYGEISSNPYYITITNSISNTGIVANDQSGAGTGRSQIAACSYGTDKGIFGFGYTSTFYSITNLISNVGIVSSNVSSLGYARSYLGACSYGIDKGIFGFGIYDYSMGYSVNITNSVSNVGVVQSNSGYVGTSRWALAACSYGTDKGIFGFGLQTLSDYTKTNVTNLVSNVGVTASDTTGVGSARTKLASCGYGTDKGIFGYGKTGNSEYSGFLSMTNLISNVGVTASDTTGVGTARSALAASIYGSDKGIFGYGFNGGYLSLTNTVSNIGTVASDTVGVGTARYGLAACGYGS